MMKFLSFNLAPIDRMADTAAASDKLAKNPPPGYKMLKAYTCMANPFPGVPQPPGTVYTVTLIECDNEASMAVASLEMSLAGMTVNRVPVLEMDPSASEKTLAEMKR